MHNRIRLLMTALLAVLGLSLAAGSASASRAIETGGARSVTASGRLKFGEIRLEAAREITCDVTLLRTIGGTISKAAGTLFGKVTGVAIDRGGNLGEHCRHGGSILGIGDIQPLADAGRPGVHRELGNGVLLYDVTGGRAELWKLIYDEFLGILPNIEGIDFHIQGTQFNFIRLLTILGNEECGWEGNSYGLLEIRAGVGRNARVVLERTTLRRTRGGVLCPEPARFEGTFTVSPEIRIRLI